MAIGINRLFAVLQYIYGNRKILSRLFRLFKYSTVVMLYPLYKYATLYKTDIPLIVGDKVFIEYLDSEGLKASKAIGFIEDFKLKNDSLPSNEEFEGSIKGAYILPQREYRYAKCEKLEYIVYVNLKFKNLREYLTFYSSETKKWYVYEDDKTKEKSTYEKNAIKIFKNCKND